MSNQSFFCVNKPCLMMGINNSVWIDALRSTWVICVVRGEEGVSASIFYRFFTIIFSFELPFFFSVEKCRIFNGKSLKMSQKWIWVIASWGWERERGEGGCCYFELLSVLKMARKSRKVLQNIADVWGGWNDIHQRRLSPLALSQWTVGSIIDHQRSSRWWNVPVP